MNTPPDRDEPAQFARMLLEVHESNEGIMDEILNKLACLRRINMDEKRLQVEHAKALVRSGRIELVDAMILVYTLQDLQDYGY
jgi:hypothetical protein